MKKCSGKIILLAAGILCGFLLASTSVRAAEAEKNAIEPLTEAMLVLQEAKVHAAITKNSPVLGTLQAGGAVNVCGKIDKSLYEIVYGNGIGYVEQKYLQVIPIEDTMRAALAEQAVFVRQNLAQQQALADATAQQAAQVQTELPGQQALIPAGGGNVIFVGDSRTGQMSNAVGGPAAFPGTAFVSCYGGGVEWLSTPKAKEDIDRFVIPGSIIVINYGVNDLSNHDEYIATINSYNREWQSRGAVVFFASVGPVGENEYGKRNWAVEYFNDQLKNRLDGSIGRIDLYNYLKLTGCVTQADGIHYTPDTYARMFQYLMQSIGKM